MTSEISPRGAFSIIPMLALPILVYIGSMLNIAHNNSLLLLAVLLVCLFAFAICNLISEKFYPLAILTISLSLLFQVQWMSPYLIGYDVHLEYFLFESVKSSGHWNPEYVPVLGGIPQNMYNSALSVTILPAMVQSLLAADDTAIFKTMFPLAFSLVPLVMYLAYKHVIDSKRAFLSAVLLMSYSEFFQGVAFLGKQNIAEVIFALLILLIFRGRSSGYGRPLTMLVLITGLVISHYSSAYLFLSFLALSSLILVALVRKPANTFLFVIVGWVLALVWYLSTAGGAAFTALVRFGYNVYEGIISGFFIAGTRGQYVLKAFGIGMTPALVNSIDLLVHYSIQFFMVVGLVGLWKQRKSVNGQFLSFALIGIVLVVAGVVVPYFEGGINFGRIYHIALIFLSPACVLGAESTFGKLFHALSTLNSGHWQTTFKFKSVSDRNLAFAASIIILFLLFNTGFVQEISGTSPISLSLGFNRMRESDEPKGPLTFLYGTYVPEEDYGSATWLSSVKVPNQGACADYSSRNNVLLSYARIPLEQKGAAVLLPGSRPSCAYIYLSYMNTVKGVGTGPSYYTQPWPMSGVNSLVSGRNKIYSNGTSDILA